MLKKKLIIVFELSIEELEYIDKFIERRIIPLQKKYPHAEIRIEVRN